MKIQKSLTIALSIVISPFAVAAQSSKAEQEVRAFVAAYDKAVASRDITFLQHVIPDDYVFTGASGRKSDRAQVLNFFTQQRDKPSARMISLKHENVLVRAVGNMAVVTNDYTSQTTPIDAPTAEPTTYTGRHTGVFEKRNGRWMVIAEQDTEQTHDDKLMERQVTKAGRDFNDLMKRLNDGRSYAELETSGDLAALQRVLATEYICTCGDGDSVGKAQELESYKTSHISFQSAELSEQKVLAIDNNAAVESGKVRYVALDAGKPIIIIKRYTRTWVSWGHGWQIVAQHISLVNE
ncbi:nuclear transport factor 2 family protein [Gemmatimonas sp.]|uniref:nuclear transport factor 2 family protein n=1 Tax=Gemmatimonas sp. TaxID=1962908 RepID=UPI00286E77A6|nr:nuclear transport factor 2 family protein [Gemmatimonas sp.]